MRLFEANYAGFPCQVRLIETDGGDDIVTRRGNVHARKGDYVAIGVDEAPPGFRGSTIDRVIRRNDRKLTVGAEIVPPEERVKDVPEVMDDPQFGDPQALADVDSPDDPE